MMRSVLCVVMVFTLAISRAQTPPVKPQFEVASVKPSASNETGGFPLKMRELIPSNQRPGQIPMTGTDRVRLQNWALLDLVAAAYSVRPTQVSGPAWLSDQSFDIEAKVPEGTPKEDLNTMLQSLLEDRFGLKVHNAAKTGQGFALIVGKDGSKLIPASPPPASAEALTDEEQKEQRAQFEQKFQAGAAAMMQQMQERTAAVGAFNTQSWGSITMEELAAQLVRPAGAPVVDATGLTGKYSVTIETWKNPDVPGGTIFDAVEKLGLKLEPRKVSVETIVVDQISRTPTAN